MYTFIFWQFSKLTLRLVQQLLLPISFYWGKTPNASVHIQVAQIYQSIEFARLCTLVPFVDAFQLERCIVDAARHCDLQVSAVERLVWNEMCIAWDEKELVDNVEEEARVICLSVLISLNHWKFSLFCWFVVVWVCFFSKP